MLFHCWTRPKLWLRLEVYFFDYHLLDIVFYVLPWGFWLFWNFLLNERGTTENSTGLGWRWSFVELRSCNCIVPAFEDSLEAYGLFSMEGTGGSRSWQGYAALFFVHISSEIKRTLIFIQKNIFCSNPNSSFTSNTIRILFISPFYWTIQSIFKAYLIKVNWIRLGGKKGVVGTNG